jgi:hypothetical protein
MRMRISLMVLSAACLLAGCATAYQPDGVSGGYSENLQGSTAQVSFRVNAMTTPETLHSFVLRRCAEVTLQDGYSYFVLVHTEAPNEANEKPYSMKIETATIQMYQGIKPQNDARAYEAASLLRTILAQQGESEAPALPSVVGSTNNVVTANAAPSSPAQSLIANPNPNALTNDAVHFDHW